MSSSAMVRLTRSVVLQGISKVSIDKRDTLEVDKDFGRITHLHLQRKNITTLVIYASIINHKSIAFTENRYILCVL